jgi:hypothetical protein
MREVVRISAKAQLAVAWLDAFSTNDKHQHRIMFGVGDSRINVSEHCSLLIHLSVLAMLYK